MPASDALWLSLQECLQLGLKRAHPDLICCGLEERTTLVQEGPAGQPLRPQRASVLWPLSRDPVPQR